MAEPMIDWETTFDVARQLLHAGGELDLSLADVEDTAPVFRNRGYPLSPLPLFVRGDAIAQLIPDLEGYVRLLNKVIRLYRHDETVRRWYDLGPAAETLIAAEGNRPLDIAACRLDGYLERGTERLCLLENNADAPAGTLFTPRLHQVVQAVLGRTGIAMPPHAAIALPTERALLDVLTARLPARSSPTLAVLQIAGRENQESIQMTAAFRRLGVDAVVADPGDITCVGGNARLGGRRIDGCWNKVNTVHWRDLIDRKPGLLEQWVRILQDTDIVHINPFTARYVAESKLTLALVQDERFAERFTSKELQLAHRLLPWSRIVHEGAVAPDRTTPLIDSLLENPQRYVLKDAYDIRGDGVTVGWATRRSDWEDAVSRATTEPTVAQEHVAPTSYPVIRPRYGSHPPSGRAAISHGSPPTERTPRVVDMPVSLDAFVLDGRVAFLGSKASLEPRLNLFQGGQKLAVHVTPSRAREAESADGHATDPQRVGAQVTPS